MTIQVMIDEGCADGNHDGDEFDDRNINKYSMSCTQSTTEVVSDDGDDEDDGDDDNDQSDVVDVCTHQLDICDFGFS